MKTFAVALAACGLASAATGASAAAASSDVDFLQASRCRGLAVGLGADAAGFTAYVKAQSQGRSPSVLDRADEEFARAKREAHGDAKDRLAAALSGACAAYAAPTGAAH